MVEFELDGGPTGQQFEFDGPFPIASDPAGGVVVVDPLVGYYTADQGGSQRLPDGTARLGVAYVLVYRCGDTLDDCGTWRVDRDHR